MKTILAQLLIILLPLLGLGSESWIRINQLGYTGESIKTAVLGCKGDLVLKSFRVVDVLTGETVLKSNHIQEQGAYSSFDKVFRLNFSEIQTPGSYQIQAAGVSSPPFQIRDDVYAGAADFLLKYMRQQRCGYNPFLQDSCHTHDGFIVDTPWPDSTHLDVTGGWHDASDYLQYLTTSANAIYQMLFAFERNPDSFADHFDTNGGPGANGIPDILDEAKWGLDWLVKMNPEYGIMYNQIADDRDHTKFTLPSLDSVSYGKGRERPVYFVTGKPQGLAKYKNRSTGVSSSAAKFASAFALGSEVLTEHYPEFCQEISLKAVDAYRFALSDLGVNQTASNRAPYFYEEDNYTDDLELAAAQLYKNLKDPYYLKEAVYWGKLEPVTPWMSTNKARHYQWYPFVNLGHAHIAEMADSLNKTIFTEFLKQGLTHIQSRGVQNGFYMGVPFIWCSNNLVAAALTQCRLYNELTGDTQFLEMEAALRDWLFGCNPWGTSMIVAYPEYADTPVDPHAAQTAVFNLEIPGGLIDGPVYTSIFESLRGLKIVNGDEYAEFQSDLCVYHDDYGDYSTNEPTMDGTASLSYYLSSLAPETSIKMEKNQYYRGAIVRGDTSKPEIHLVFTGHKYADGGTHIRRILKQHNVPAHFFFTGDFYRNRAYKKLIKGLVKDGHYLGAHSDKHLLYVPWDNRDTLLISRDAFIHDLQANYREMKRFGVSKTQAPLFLPPYEWYNESIGKWTNELGLTLINFSPGTRSTSDYTTPDLGGRYLSSESIYQSILEFEASSPTGMNGFILLLHVGTHPDRTDKFYMELEKLILELNSKGYTYSLLEASN